MKAVWIWLTALTAVDTIEGHDSRPQPVTGKRHLARRRTQGGRRNLGKAKSTIKTNQPTLTPTLLPTRVPTLRPVDRAPAPSGDSPLEPTLALTASPSLLPSLDEEYSPFPTFAPSSKEQVAPSPTISAPVESPPPTETDVPVSSSIPTIGGSMAPAGTPAPDPSLPPFFTLPTTQSPISPVEEQPSPLPPGTTLGPTPIAPPQSTTIEPTQQLQECGGLVQDTILLGLGTMFDASTALVDANSYQCRAFHRVAEQEGSNDFSFATAVKYWVLYCIYFATNAATGSDGVSPERQVDTITATTWIHTGGWRENDLDPCIGWYGIHCDTEGRITNIRLERNGLSGIFPGEVALLSTTGPRATGAGNLKRLDISNNPDLSNDPTDPWISELGNGLEYLNYGSTKFTGAVPKLPSNIVEYDCSNTLHSGTLSDDIFEGLQNLTMLIMDGNSFDSSVPRTVASLPKLKVFSIREAGLTGDLSYMQGMPSIVEHLVDGNPNLVGPVYSFIGELTTLQSFSASDCGLTGVLPTELGNLEEMVQLWLYGNDLSGQIPSELARMSQLRILALEDTNIEGEVPIEICLQRFSGELSTLSMDCHDGVDCTAFFPDCCSCCGRDMCGT